MHSAPMSPNLLPRVRRWILPVTTGGLCVVSLGVVAYWICSVPPGRMARLPDGTRLRFLGATAGNAPPFYLGAPWQENLARVLPPSLVGLGPTRVPLSSRALSSGPTKDLTLWFEQSGRAVERVGGLGRPWVPEYSNIEVAAVGTGGPAIAASIWFRVDVAGRQSPPRALVGQVFSAVPRRERTITVRVYLVSYGRPHRRGVRPHRTRVAEFRIANPAFRPYPAWPAGHLPAVARYCGLKFVVDGWEVASLSTGDVPRRSTTGTLRYRVERDGQPVRSWEPDIGSLTDATGNEFGFFLHSPDTARPKSRGAAVSITPPPVPGETAFDLRLRWCRPWTSMPIRTVDSWIALPAPSRRTEQPLPQVPSANFLLGSRRLQADGQDTAELVIWEHHEGRRHRVVRAVDDRGRAVAITAFYPHGGNGSTVHLRFPRNAQQLRVTVGEYETVKLTFRLPAPAREDLKNLRR